jgi:hypothetical protein
VNIAAPIRDITASHSLEGKISRVTGSTSGDMPDRNGDLVAMAS